jgi:hypothetical protein
MQLKVKRSQRSGGLLGGKVIFILDARAEPSAEEASLIKKYALGKLIVYDSEARRKHQTSTAAHFEAASAGLASSGTGKAIASSMWSNARGLASAAMMSLSLSVTIDGMIAGQHIECKDLTELLGAEGAMREACQTVKSFIDLAATFDGREEVLEF